MTDKVERNTPNNSATPELDDDTKKAFEKTNAVILSMSDSYVHEAQRLTRALNAAINASNDPGTDEFERQIFLEDAFQASHELRGQAGMFGYGLLTELCQSLCSLLEIEQTSSARCKEDANELWSSIQNHTTIVSSIVKNDIKGDGGKLGMALKSEVGRLRRHVTTLAA